MVASTPLPYPSKLAGKRVLVFGGTSGIGFSVAALALAEGAHVHISSSNPSKLAASIEKLRAGYPGANIAGAVCDLSEEQNIEANLRTLLEEVTKSGPLDHVAFTAGNALAPGHISTVTAESIRNVGTVRFVAPALLAKLLVSEGRFFTKSAASSVTFTSGTNTAKPTKDWAVIAAYGSAIEGLSRGLSIDMAPVRVNTVSPGAVDTEIFDGIPSEARDGVKDFFAKATTTGEMGRPENIAEAYLYVMKDRAVVGKVIESDGGRLLV